MPITYTYKQQGDGRDSWIAVETDSQGRTINKYLVYEDPNKKEAVRDFEKLSTEDISTIKSIIGIAGSGTQGTTGAQGTAGSTGAQGVQGRQGVTGTGTQGTTGAQGATGTSSTITVGTTYTVSAGSSATVQTNVVGNNTELRFFIPTGAQGVQGPAGGGGGGGAVQTVMSDGSEGIYVASSNGDGTGDITIGFTGLKGSVITWQGFSPDPNGTGFALHTFDIDGSIVQLFGPWPKR